MKKLAIIRTFCLHNWKRKIINTVFLIESNFKFSEKLQDQNKELIYTLSRDPHSNIAFYPHNDLYSQRIQECSLYPVVLNL